MKIWEYSKKKDIDLTGLLNEEKSQSKVVKKSKHKKVNKKEIIKETINEIETPLNPVSLKSDINDNVSNLQTIERKESSDFLSNLERDNLYAILGLIIDNSDNKEDIYSVEYIFELKSNCINVIENDELDCKIINTSVDTISELKDILDLYIESILKNTKLKPETLSYLVIIFMK